MHYQLEKHRTRSKIPSHQIQARKRENRDMTYRGEKDEPLNSLPMTNLELQHVIVQHRQMKRSTSISPYYIEKFSQSIGYTCRGRIRGTLGTVSFLKTLTQRKHRVRVI
ncbi:unnamed protein product [Pleuronectes platessa]|uniref:Uncharacterized protein n=1 Tax=Pleuronectes platessa TaxID=8262 RepID=A0A9N7VLA7_PLEPL|nr:unnamed protein product [Pleuronectes platessa]